jgi:molybdopterin converting factor small subunit
MRQDGAQHPMYVEFLGIPRERAGLSEVEIEAETLGQLFGALAARFPMLGDLITDGRLHPSMAANLNGDRFVSRPDTPLDTGDHVLILSADVGG